MVKVKCWGTAGDGARALLPWTAGPGAQRTLIPSTSSRRTPRAEALPLLVCLIQLVFICVSLLKEREREREREREGGREGGRGLFKEFKEFSICAVITS